MTLALLLVAVVFAPLLILAGAVVLLALFAAACVVALVTTAGVGLALIFPNSPTNERHQ